MKKRLFAGLLTAALLLGMIPPIPTQAVGADAGTGNGAEQVHTVTPGADGTQTFTDANADPNAAYEYVIEGTDGSREVVNVGPRVMENTGNSIVKGQTKYKKVTSLAEITDGNYLIIGAHGGYNEGWAIKPGANTNDFVHWDNTSNQLNNRKQNPIVVAYPTLEWEIKKKPGTAFYTVKKPNEELYLNLLTGNAANNAVKMSNQPTNIEIKENRNATNGFGISKENVNGYINSRGASNTSLGAWTDNDGGSALFLYKKYNESTLNPAGLRALIEQSGHYKEMEDATNRRYTSESWNTFQAAKTAAQSKVNDTTVYVDQASADAALRAADEAYTLLWDAILNLTPEVKKYEDGSVQAAEVAVPSIIWQRTLEFNNQNNGELAVDVQHLNPNDFSKIQWNWRDVAGLTTNPTMTVWDYNTDHQYTTKTNDQPRDITAATWCKHSTGDDWKKSTVRKFSGEFKWPEGYDLSDTAKFVSVNDDKYKAIYDYIKGKQQTEPELYERYKDATVMPINDDMYVVMYKDQDAPQSTNEKSFSDRLVFWTGTSGKGIWSRANDSSNDWGRRVPALFGTEHAIPAYYGYYPNTKHLNSAATMQELPNDIKAKLKHSDTWYTMVNTSTVMSELNSLYRQTGIKAGEKMHIDIYCFNNSGNGGMDQLELKFVKRQQTSAKVQVNYFLDSLSKDNWLGSTHQADAEVGKQIVLQAGTEIHNLNYKKAAAIEKAGSGYEILDGVQQVNPHVVVAGKVNHINVIYKRQIAQNAQTKHYTYDFGGNNEYTHELFNTDVGNQIQSVTLTNNPKGLSVEYVPGERQCKLTYTPSDARREQVMGILNVSYVSNGTTHNYNETVYIYPASNVLYEQGYFTPADGSRWTLKNQNGQDATAVNKTVIDNMSTVYGYTDSYKEANSEELAYTAVVDSTTNKRTGEIKTTFGGNGFDLIGSCGPTTGTLAVRVTDSNGNVEKAYIVDTKLTDTKYGTIHHVPLVHCQLDTDDTYNVAVQGIYINYGSNGGAKTMSMNETNDTEGMAVGEDPVSQVYDVLYDMGLTESDINNVEFISVGDNVDVATYAANNTNQTTTPNVTVPNEMTLSVDAIRVYGNTKNANYVDSEKNLTYKNVMDCIRSNEFGAYAEPNGSVSGGNYTAANYEALGGPENEVYLEKPESALVLAEAKQVSLRSVTGEPIQVSINGQAAITVTSPVEMYYTVTGDPETAGTTTIKKVGANNSTSTLLAIGNVKHAGTMVPVTAEQYASAFALLSKEVPGPGESVKPEQPETPQNPEETYFVPEKFDVRMDTVKIGRRTKVTITAETSKDVEYITVNGKKVKASNDKTTIKGFLQNLFDKLTGKAENPDVRKFVFTKRYPTKKLEGMNHEVISYNKDQLASKPVIAEEVSK